MRGIDAPSLRGKCQQEKELAKKSKDFLHFLIKDERFTLHNIERGKYFRILADIRLSDGRNVSEIMLFNNHAVEYDGAQKLIIGVLSLLLFSTQAYAKDFYRYFGLGTSTGTYDEKRFDLYEDVDSQSYVYGNFSPAVKKNFSQQLSSLNSLNLNWT